MPWYDQQYGNPYAPYNYPQNVGNQQQYRQPPARPCLNGRFVNDINEIQVFEVPQDGSLGLFPKQDGSCIFAKSWCSDGTIRTIKYVPENLPQQDERVNAFENVMTRLEKIETMLTKLVE